MKKIEKCERCGQKRYVNEDNLCKRCNHISIGVYKNEND